MSWFGYLMPPGASPFGRGSCGHIQLGGEFRGRPRTYWTDFYIYVCIYLVWECLGIPQEMQTDEDVSRLSNSVNNQEIITLS